MWTVIAWLKNNLVWSIPIFMVAGLIFGAIVNPAFLKSAIIPLTFLMVYPMMINLQVQKVFSGGDIKVQLVTQVINFAVVPFVAYGLAMIFFWRSPLCRFGVAIGFAAAHQRHDHLLDRIC